MVLVIASAIDEAAQALVDRFASGAAALLTPLDLSVVGTRVSTRAFLDGLLAARHGVIRLDEVAGVVTLLPCVYPQELVHITKEDRSYVASEMTAFLSYILSELPCPKLNAPTSFCLSGPNWQQEHWATLSHRLKIPVGAVSRCSPQLPSGDVSTVATTAVTVVGCDVVGPCEELIGVFAARLARAAGLDLLRTSFEHLANGGLRMVSATQFVDVTDEEVSAAIVRYFGQRRT